MEPKYFEAYDLQYRQIHQQNLQWSSDTPTPIVAEVLAEYPLSPDARVLEIGCGEGRDAFPLLQKGYKPSGHRSLAGGRPLLPGEDAGLSGAVPGSGLR